MKRIPRTALIAAGLVAMASIIGGGIVFAQTSGSNSPLGNLASLTTQAGPNSGQSDYITQLATNLGVDVATLKAAIATTNGDELKKAVAAGTITQAQADKIAAALPGDTFFFGAHGSKTPGNPAVPGKGGPFFGAITDVEGSVATFLGVTPAQLKTELQGGKSLADVATAHEKTRDDLKTYLTTQANAQIERAVSDGKLAQAQADMIKSALSTHLDQIIDAKPGSIMPHSSGGTSNGPMSPRGGPRQPSGTNSFGLN